MIARLKPHLPFLVILILALLLRFYNFSSWQGFDYDQEVNAWLAKFVIVDHKPILIGPETSVGGMYVGPYFNYIVAFFFALGKMNPAPTLILNILISAATITTFYFSGRDIFNKRVGLLASALYSFSSLAINYDRVLWNPTPMPLVSLLTLWFMLRYLRRRALIDLLICVSAAAFSLHLHLQGLLLVGFFFLCLGVFRKNSLLGFRSVLLIILVLAVSIFPLLLFDLRHNFLNSQHFWQFIFQRSPTPGIAFSSMPIPMILGQLPELIFVPDWILPPTWYLAVFAGMMVFLAIKSILKKILIYQLFFLMMVLALTLSFYHGPLPLQYFLFILPVIIVSAADLLLSLYNRGEWIQSLLAVFLAISLFKNVVPIAAYSSQFSLQNKQQAVKYIIADARGRPFKVDFITDARLNTGFRYLFWQQGENLITDMTIPTTRTYKIVIPFTLAHPEELAIKFGAVGVVKI